MLLSTNIDFKSKLKLLTIFMKWASSLFKPLTNLGLSSTGLDPTLISAVLLLLLLLLLLSLLCKISAYFCVDADKVWMR